MPCSGAEQLYFQSSQGIPMCKPGVRTAEVGDQPLLPALCPAQLYPVTTRGQQGPEEQQPGRRGLGPGLLRGARLPARSVLQPHEAHFPHQTFPQPPWVRAPSPGSTCCPRAPTWLLHHWVCRWMRIEGAHWPPSVCSRNALPVPQEEPDLGSQGQRMCAPCSFHWRESSRRSCSSAEMCT